MHFQQKQSIYQQRRIIKSSDCKVLPALLFALHLLASHLLQGYRVTSHATPLVFGSNGARNVTETPESEARWSVHSRITTS